MTAAVIRLVMPDVPDPAALRTAIAEALAPEWLEPVEGELIYFDSFDSRLDRAGLRLFRQPDVDGPRLVLAGRDDGGVRLRVPSELDAPALSDALPGALPDRLASILGLRAVMPLVRLGFSRLACVARDGEGKVVLRIAFDCIRQADDGTPVRQQVTVEGVRGYPGPFEAAGRRLRYEWRLLQAARDPLSRALAVRGHRPEAPRGKPRLDLAPDTPAAEAVRGLVAHLFAVMRANEAGIVRDIDTEFLHDYRVALRRLRTLIARVRHVLSPEEAAVLGTELRWLFDVTGPLRDLDVHLVGLPDHAGMLPEGVRGDLGPLRRHIEARRAESLAAVVNVLASGRYRRLSGRIERLVEDGDSEAWTGAAAARPVAEVAARAIRRTYKRLRREGRAIDDASPDRDLHEMRKTAKKLRYLLEFFRSLYPASSVRPAIKALETLQDRLGEHQDLHVHAESLEAFAREMMETRAAPAATLLAMGRLVHVFEERKAEVRGGLDKALAAFGRAETRAHFRALFRAHAREHEQEAA